MKKVPQLQKGLTVTGTVGEFASLTAEANYGLAFTRLCSTTLGHISRIRELGQWPVYSLPDTWC